MGGEEKWEELKSDDERQRWLVAVGQRDSWSALVMLFVWEEQDKAEYVWGWEQRSPVGR